MKPFRERNPVPIGIVSLAVLAAGVYTAFHAQDLTIFGGGGAKYYAYFPQAGDLNTTEEVRVSGVKVGKVTKIDIAPKPCPAPSGPPVTCVRVQFRLSPGNHIGDASSAAIKIKTVVGARYLEITSVGTSNLPAGGSIPLARTNSPYSFQDAFNGLVQTQDQINVDQLAQSFNTVSDTFANTPALNKAALTGLSRLSNTIASRDTQLASLLNHAQAVTQTLNSRDAELTKLIGDSDLVLQVVNQRRAVIEAVLQHSAQLADELTGLARDNKIALGPALANLHSVLAVLQADHKQLDQAVTLIAPFVRDFANTLGNGRWFDTYLQNLPPQLDISALIAALSTLQISGAPTAGAGHVSVTGQAASSGSHR